MPSGDLGEPGASTARHPETLAVLAHVAPLVAPFSLATTSQAEMEGRMRPHSALAQKKWASATPSQ